MKHILLVSLFSLLNILAFAQVCPLLVRAKSISEPLAVFEKEQINDIQAMARRNDPSHSFASQRKGAIIVEEQVLFTRPDVVTTVGAGVMKFPEMSDNLDAILGSQSNSVKGEVSTEKPTNAQNTEGPLSKIEILNNINKQQSAAQNQDTDSYIRISPNPINDAAVVEMGKAIHGTFQVFDITGRLLNRGQFEGNQFILERKDLNKGVYILRVLDEKSVIATKKIVVN
jgi:hypothetical protein